MGVHLLASIRQFLASKHILLLLLIAGLVHGLLYYAIIPPWWHFDEPGHFEYAWLAANRSGWPTAGEYDENMRLQMARSMYRYGWYSFRNYYPDLSGRQPVWIGTTQTGDQPAYYFLISLPLRLLRNASITFQYDVARLVSLVLFLLIILVVWKAMGEIVPDGHPLKWIVTAFVVLLPPFVDEMVSVNNDVAAVLASCLFLWISLQLIRRGISILRLVFFVATLAFCYLAKSTTWYALAVAPLVLILALLRGRWTWLIWALTGLSLVAGAFLTLEGGNPTAWYQSQTQVPPLRFQTNQAPLGRYVFQVDDSKGRTPDQTGQFLDQQLVKSLRGQTLTLGLWAWSDSSIQANGPSIRFATTAARFNNQTYGPLSLGTKPTFLRMAVEVPIDASFAILIPPYPLQKPITSKIYFDAVVLAPGQHGDTPPQFTDPEAAQGTWDGLTFHNLIRNGSAERGSLRVQPWSNNISSKLTIGGDLALTFSTLEDWQGTGWYYQGVISSLVVNFWSYMAGGHLGLPGNFSDNFMVGLTLLGLLGTAVLLWQKRRRLPWDILYLLGLSLVLIWAVTGIRGAYSLLTSNPLYPWTRYASPAILPTTLLLCVGWLEWIELAGQRLNQAEEKIKFIPVAVMLGIAAYTFLDVIGYFHPYLTNFGFLALLVGLQYLAYKGLSWSVRKLGAPSSK